MPYDNQASLFKVLSTTPKAPALRVVVNIDGTEYSAGLWAVTRKDGSRVKDRNGNQIYSGPIELKTGQQKGQQQAPPPAATPQAGPDDPDLNF